MDTEADLMTNLIYWDSFWVTSSFKTLSLNPERFLKSATPPNFMHYINGGNASFVFLNMTEDNFPRND